MLALSHFQQAGAPPSWLLSPVDRTLIIFDGFLALWYFKKLQDIRSMFCPRLWICKPGKRCSSPQSGAQVTAAPGLVQKKSLDFPLRTYTSFSFPHVCRWQFHSVMEWRQKPQSQPWVSFLHTYIHSISKSIGFIFKTHPDPDHFLRLTPPLAGLSPLTWPSQSPHDWFFCVSLLSPWQLMCTF